MLVQASHCEIVHPQPALNVARNAYPRAREAGVGDLQFRTTRRVVAKNVFVQVVDVLRCLGQLLHELGVGHLLARRDCVLQAV